MGPLDDALREYEKRLKEEVDCLAADFAGSTYLNDDVPRLLRALRVALPALNAEASWDEGEVVTSSFDNPSGANKARSALFAIEAILRGTEPGPGGPTKEV